MPDPRICCAVGVCCDPPEAAAALAAHDEIPLEAAVKILAGYRLVPKTLNAVGAAKETALALAAQKELAQVHKLIRARLPRILEDLGHGKMELRPPEEPA